jgi:predicted acylesterase/phospholipase RssA
MPLAVGVIDYQTKEFSLISSGDLSEAVAASCAIPLLFKPVLGNVYNILITSRLVQSF